MDKALKAHIRRLQNRAIFSLVAILIALSAIIFGIVFLFRSPFVAIGLFAIALICVVYALYSNRQARREEKETIPKPVSLSVRKCISFDKIVSAFENMTDAENRISTSAEMRFFRIHNILRIIVYHTECFHKTAFDRAKARINQKANKALNISPWVNRFDAIHMMRCNLIVSETLNDALYVFMSQNANRNLTRVEGVIHIAIVGEQIMLPPLYGHCDLAEIHRYKRVIEWIDRLADEIIV